MTTKMETPRRRAARIKSMRVLVKRLVLLGFQIPEDENSVWSRVNRAKNALIDAVEEAEGHLAGALRGDGPTPRKATAP